MHNPVPSSAPSPPPAFDSHQHHHHDIHAPPSPDEPPPSYDDATRLESAPLLVGPPPDYGAFRAYVDPEESSIASTEPEARESALPEWFGQALVVFVFICIIYGFWSVVNAPENPCPGGYPQDPRC